MIARQTTALFAVATALATCTVSASSMAWTEPTHPPLADVDTIMACGVDSPSSDMYALGKQIALTVGSRINCQEYCNRSYGCKSSVWTDFNGGTCWFKSSMDYTTVLPTKKGSVAATFAPKNLAASQLVVAPINDCDFAGNDIGSQVAPSTSCGLLCVANTDCWAWSWSNYNGGTCWFKSQATECTVNKGVLSSYVWKNVATAGKCLGAPASGPV